MNVSGPALQIIQELESTPALTEASTQELTREISRLNKLRNRAQRLNREAFREALTSAQAKAPALVAHNGMMSASEIEHHQSLIENESQVVRQEVFALLEDRIFAVRVELSRRTSAYGKSAFR